MYFRHSCSTRTCKLRKHLYKLIDHSFWIPFPQVAAEGLRRILNITKFWSSLTQTEQFGTLEHLKKLFDLQLEKPDVFVLIKLLETATYLVGSIVRSSYRKDFIKICLRYLPERNKAGLGMIVCEYSEWCLVLDL